MGISVEHLSFSYCSRAVLEDVSLQADSGTLTAVLGPNGVGKTTLFRCILGFHTKYRGMVLLDGVDRRTLSPRQTAHRIAYIPQIHGSAFAYSVEDMVLMGTAHALGTLSLPGEKERQAAHAALDKLGIGHLATRNYAHLSGGEQQLVLIARALAQNTRLLLMDEPTASLDYGNQCMLLSHARALADEGYTVLLTTHDPQHALWYADRALALEHGRVAAWGAPREILTPELIRRLFGVETTFTATDGAPLIAPVLQGGAR